MLNNIRRLCFMARTRYLFSVLGFLSAIRTLILVLTVVVCRLGLGRLRLRLIMAAV